MNRIKHLLLDLDHTLWDTEGNAREVLLRLYALWDLEGKYAGGFPDFFNAYIAANDQLWLELQKGGITIEQIRLQRFEECIGQRLDHTAIEGMAADFMRLMERAPLSMEGATDTLRTLRQHYTLSVCTNGRTSTQAAKLRAASLDKLIDNLFVSDNIGALKPQPQFFNAVLQRLGATPQECVMVGDNPLTDIGGAIDAGIPTIWFNSRHMECHLPTERIGSLGELPDRLTAMETLTLCTPTDIPSIQAIANRAFPNAFKNILSDEQTQYMMQMMYSTASLKQQWAEGHWYSLLREGGQPVGYVSVSPQSAEVCHIQKIYLLPECRGRRLGDRLFNEGLRLARLMNPNVRAVELNVNRHNPAVAFYERLGLRRDRSVDINIGQGFQMNDYIMRREL